MQGLASNVDQLCKELGCNTQQQQSGVPRPPGNGDSSTLLTDIRQLVLGMQARDQNFNSLQIAVHGLLNVLSASDAQKGAGRWLFQRFKGIECLLNVISIQIRKRLLG